MKIFDTSSPRARVGLLFCALFAVVSLPNSLHAQIALPISPTNVLDPRVLHNNPAAIRVATPTAYLGLKLIYPGVLDNNAFALKTSLFNLATSNLAGSEIGAAAHGHFFSAPLYSESRFGLAGARSFGERLHVGIDLSLQTRRYALENFEGIDRNDPVFQNGTSVSAFDPSAGLLFEINEMLTLGASVLHFTRPNLALGKTAYRQPIETLLGIGFTQRFARFDLGAHYWQNRFRPLFGAEIFDNEVGRLRLGFALNNAMLEGQLALRSNAALFYNFSLPTSDLGLVTAGSHEFGLAYVFHPHKQKDDSDYISFVTVPDSLSLRPGDSAPFTLRLAAEDEVQQVMELKLNGAPPGLRLRPQQAKLSSRDETIISLQSEKSLAPGVYEILLAGNSRGKRGESKLNLKVLAAPKLFARVTASVDTVMITESREIREELPLIPRVFFAKNSEQLAQSRYDLLSAEQRDKFSQDVQEINSAYRNLLNIIAERLRKNANARVTIRGYSPGAAIESNAQELALRRAQYIRDYLIQNLGVNAAQLFSEAGKPDIAEAKDHNPLRLEELQRVDLEVAPEFEEEIFAPIQFEKKEIDAIPATCDFRVSELSPGAGLAQWRLVLIAGADTIKTFAAPEFDLSRPITWNLQSDQQRLANFWQEVNYSLALRDSWGQTYQTPVRSITSRHVQAQPKQIEKIPLILFAFDDFQLDQTSRRLRAKLVQIAAKLKADPLAQCDLLGFTDSIGEAAHNLQLSQRRAQNVFNELARMGIAPSRMRFKGFGLERALANNDLPEGRMLNRRVEVHIRHAQQMSTK